MFAYMGMTGVYLHPPPKIDDLANIVITPICNIWVNATEAYLTGCNLEICVEKKFL